VRAISPILAHLTWTREDLIDAASVIPESHWKRRPGEGAWSAAEVIAHVTMVEQTIIERASKGVQKPPKIVPFWRRLHVPLALATWRGIKRKTPIPLDPGLVADRQPAFDQLLGARKATLEFVEATRDRDLEDYRFPHPFFGSLDVYEWLRMIGCHDVRHAKQIRETVQTFRLQ
jgi:hypothetical protein